VQADSRKLDSIGNGLFELQVTGDESSYSPLNAYPIGIAISAGVSK